MQNPFPKDFRVRFGAIGAMILAAGAIAIGWMANDAPTVTQTIVAISEILAVFGFTWVTTRLNAIKAPEETKINL